MYGMLRIAWKGAREIYMLSCVSSFSSGLLFSFSFLPYLYVSILEYETRDNDLSE